MKKFLTAAMCLLSAPHLAMALPEVDETTGMMAASLSPANSLALADDGQNLAAYDFNGIVALSNCSGSVVRFADSSPSDNALILTNGHCVSLMSPGTVYYNTSSSRYFNLLNSSAQTVGRVYAQSIVYATMTDTDLAIYKLRATYEDLESSYGVSALTLSDDYPSVGLPIEVISGYWRRGYSCSVETIVYSLYEDDWTWYDSIRYSRPGCEIIGGTSGSPVVDPATRLVVGVNNTTNEDGQRCSLNNPCEVRASGGVSYQQGYGYAQQTSWLYTCRDASGAINPYVSGCLLPSP